jgi:pimeloyl-ACP methyl ester carboxylesterase
MPRSRILDVDGPVHYVDHGGDGPTLVLVHGLGGSHSNWVSVAPELTRTARVLAIDLVGFGITPPAGRKASVESNRHVLAAFCGAVSPEAPVTLVGNSMGGLISLMTADAHPDVVEGLVLIDPALPVPSLGSVDLVAAQRLAVPLVPGVGERLVRRYNATTPVPTQLDEAMGLLCVDPTRVPDEAIESALAMMELRREMEWAPRAFTEAGRSIAVVISRRRAFRAMVHRIACRVLLLHGAQDRLVPLEASRRLAAERPEWTFKVFPDVGHVPPLEVPDQVVAAITEWLTPVRV